MFISRPLRVLVAPMDWGLGHATRCIPLIRALQKEGVEVVLGGEGRSLILLQEYFPMCAILPLPEYQITFSENLILSLMLQTPRLLRIFKKEHHKIEEYVEKWKLNGVISDNRYGAWSKKVPSVFISHQLSPISPFRRRVYELQKLFLRRFHEIWVPDHVDEEVGLSGSLSHQYPPPAHTHFIGILSRFSDEKTGGYPSQFFPENIEYLALLSGPEPYRTQLEHAIVKQLTQKKDLGQAVIVRGTPEHKASYRKGNIYYYGHVSARDLVYLLPKAKIVISRGGYSSLMDFAVLGLKKMIFIPTPRQSEQIYLAEEMRRRKIGLVYNEIEELDLESIDFDTCVGFRPVENKELQPIIRRWVEGL